MSIGNINKENTRIITVNQQDFITALAAGEEGVVNGGQAWWQLEATGDTLTVRTQLHGITVEQDIPCLNAGDGSINVCIMDQTLPTKVRHMQSGKVTLKKSGGRLWLSANGAHAVKTSIEVARNEQVAPIVAGGLCSVARAACVICTNY
ncbi:MAG: hypothetical protein HC911_17880 [Chloroflexaceae bacterium]|nr:hypothetical protein [Chloroflexaceae bacterium]